MFCACTQTVSQVDSPNQGSITVVGSSFREAAAVLCGTVFPFLSAVMSIVPGSGAVHGRDLLEEQFNSERQEAFLFKQSSPSVH